MLDKPDLDEEQLIKRLHEAFDLPIVAIDFLPLGADANTTVYRAVARDGVNYFVKLRSGDFDVMSVALPVYLHRQGVAEVIAPLSGRHGDYWARHGRFAIIVYPFVEGVDGYAVELSEKQWQRFGAAMRQLHASELPASLRSRLPHLAWTPRWRSAVQRILARGGAEDAADAVASRLVAFLHEKREETLDLVARSARYADDMQMRRFDRVVCHTDIHAGNLLISEKGALFIVDWDNPTLAPKERDLMFIGGAQGFIGRTAAEEVASFQRGYGAVEVDRIALAYYRYERILEDITLYCEDILSSDDHGADRRQALTHLMANFRPEGPIAAAIAADVAGS